MIDTARFTEADMEAFAGYVLSVLDRMAENRDVKSHPDRTPILSRFDMNRSDTRLRVDFEADFSAIGMPTNTPIVAVRTREQPGTSWWLDDVLIATTPETFTPEQTGDTLEMNALLVAFRTWLGRASRPSRGGR
jgi:hypothetical protein